MIILLTGQPNSGKTTLARALQSHLADRSFQTLHIDGDIWRTLTLNHDYSEIGRRANVAFAMQVALSADAINRMIVCSLVAPFLEQRKQLRVIGDVLEVYLHSSRRPEDKGRKSVKYEETDRLEPRFMHVNTDHSVSVCVAQIEYAITSLLAGGRHTEMGGMA
jgi:broad-specificity NMP kinase